MFGEKRQHMCIYHAVTMTAATSIMERAVQTITQDCIRMVWKGFDTFHSRLLTPCSSASHHQERTLLDFAARGSAGSYTPKSRSINLIPNSPRQRRFFLDHETRHSHRAIKKTRNGLLHLVHCGRDRSTPPVDPTILPIYPNKIKLSPLHTGTNNMTQDEMKHLSAN